MKKHKLTVDAFNKLQKQTNIQIKVLGIMQSAPSEVITRKMVRTPEADIVEFAAFRPEDEARLESLI